MTSVPLFLHNCCNILGCDDKYATVVLSETGNVYEYDGMVLRIELDGITGQSALRDDLVGLDYSWLVLVQMAAQGVKNGVGKRKSGQKSVQRSSSSEDESEDVSVLGTSLHVSVNGVRQLIRAVLEGTKEVREHTHTT